MIIKFPQNQFCNIVIVQIISLDGYTLKHVYDCGTTLGPVP